MSASVHSIFSFWEPGSIHQFWALESGGLEARPSLPGSTTFPFLFMTQFGVNSDLGYTRLELAAFCFRSWSLRDLLEPLSKSDSSVVGDEWRVFLCFVWRWSILGSPRVLTIGWVVKYGSCNGHWNLSGLGLHSRCIIMSLNVFNTPTRHVWIVKHGSCSGHWNLSGHGLHSRGFTRSLNVFNHTRNGWIVIHSRNNGLWNLSGLGLHFRIVIMSSNVFNPPIVLCAGSGELKYSITWFCARDTCLCFHLGYLFSGGKANKCLNTYKNKGSATNANFGVSTKSIRRQSLGTRGMGSTGQSTMAGSSKGVSVPYHELQGIRMGLQGAMNKGITKVCLGTDSTLAIMYIKGLTKPPWEARWILKDILDLISMFDQFRIIHVFRESNKAADYLAGLYPGMELLLIDVNAVSAELQKIVDLDAAGHIYDRVCYVLGIGSSRGLSFQKLQVVQFALLSFAGFYDLAEGCFGLWSLVLKVGLAPPCWWIVLLAAFGLRLLLFFDPGSFGCFELALFGCGFFF
ncbi:hypothetical protein GIB67_008897 [Kingdonia uniflora]|uniref:RNase H type-1 domain-containing protein n=1 Tax=Kingdonia uniflora TaxID=39325 RepID=A0A7J7LVB3_9MAGN|nr:hypothetical protein GIB67_008897 [Kingdonia uniflora]